MKYTVGSLFAGVGGVCLGFKRSSELFEMVFANEMDEAACKTYAANFDHSLIQGDIEKILDPEIILREREFLIKRTAEIKNSGILENSFDEKIVKDAAKKLDGPFFTGKAMKGDFHLTDSIKKKISKEEYPEDIFKDFVEYHIALNTLNKSTEIKTEITHQEFLNKNEEITKTRIDVLTAGFPCQAFSIAGDRKGFTDHRGELFYSVINLVNQLEAKGHGKPRVLFLENVKNLVSHDNGNTFKIIREEIEALGYTIKYKVLNTYKYTKLPQNRERIFVACFLNEADAEAFGSFEDIPMLKRNREDLRNALKTTLDYEITQESDPKLYYTREKYPQYFMTLDEFEDSGKDNWIDLNRDMDEMYEIYQVRRGMYVRKNQSGVCPTLTANMGTGGHNVPLIKTHDGIRKLSPKDCFNLQGFRAGESYILPESVSNASLYKQAGNAVSVDIIELIAKKILNAFVSNDVIGEAKNTKKIENAIQDLLDQGIDKNEINKYLEKL